MLCRLALSSRSVWNTVWKASVNVSFKSLPLVYVMCSLCVSLMSHTDHGNQYDNYSENDNKLKNRNYVSSK